MLLMITDALVTLAALNAILTAWATVLDARHASALMRARSAQTLARPARGSRRRRCFPRCQAPSSASRSASGCSRPRPEAGLGTLLAVPALTTVTAGIGARRAAAETLQPKLPD